MLHDTEVVFEHELGNKAVDCSFGWGFCNNIPE
jgi:hypothetical protein